jgi:magnesium chelatase subunit D
MLTTPNSTLLLPLSGTAARGLAKLLPPIKVGYNPESGALDPYNRERFSTGSNLDDDHANGRDDAHDNVDEAYREIPTPFVDLPIGATEDRVLGSIDFSATLKGGGKPVFLPGILAAANRGILYIDEVNLLPAHLVDVLLDASAAGIHSVQREGLTLAHPARFLMIGTMNPEEGDLRPQLLDRFGLMCDVSAPRDAILRSEVVKQRMAFERDPDSFSDRWKASESDLSARIRAARDLLSDMDVPDDFLLMISTICVEFGVASLRADITLYKTAVALAAWEGRMRVEKEDIKRAAKWALAHRKHQNPFDSSSSPPSPDNPDNSNTPDDDLMDQILNAPPPKNDGDGENNDQNQKQQHQPDSNQSPESDGYDGPLQNEDGANNHNSGND